jgi:hypothetical protein
MLEAHAVEVGQDIDAQRDTGVGQQLRQAIEILGKMLNGL